jgi:hypothetical protein
MIDKFKYVDLSDDEKSTKKYNYQKNNYSKGNYQKPNYTKGNYQKDNKYQESENNDYVRPEKTKTDLIQTKDQIIKLLDGYEELEPDEVDYLKIGNVVRYIRYDRNQNREKLLYGGIVLKVFPEYILIKGANNVKFSAPRITKNDKGKIIHITRFFRKQTDKDSKDNDEDEDSDDDKRNKKLLIIEKCNQKIIEQQEEIQRLRNELKKIYDNRKKN